MQIQIKRSGGGLTRLLFTRAIKRLDPIVHELPKDICTLLKKGKQPSGAAQPPNKLSTIRNKGHMIPGVDTGYLSTSNNWSINSMKDGWVVYPPKKREKAIKHLYPRGYVFLGFPKTWQTKFNQNIFRVLFRNNINL